MGVPAATCATQRIRPATGCLYGGTTPALWQGNLSDGQSRLRPSSRQRRRLQVADFACPQAVAVRDQDHGPIPRASFSRDFQDRQEFARCQCGHAAAASARFTYRNLNNRCGPSCPSRWPVCSSVTQFAFARRNTARFFTSFEETARQYRDYAELRPVSAAGRSLIKGFRHTPFTTVDSLPVDSGTM